MFFLLNNDGRPLNIFLFPKLEFDFLIKLSFELLLGATSFFRASSAIFNDE